jgi:GTP-binding protein
MLNVVIVGRPNVGKSSLFNRIIRQRKAVVEEISGVTRDRLLERAEWQGKEFYLTDTGGYVPSKADRIDSLVARQVDLAIAEGDIVLFVVDVRDGITPLDREIAGSLRKNGKEVLLVINKVDSTKMESSRYEFHQMGFADVFPVSSIHGRGIGDLLDRVVSSIPVEQRAEIQKAIHAAIIGKPNVGKSSFFNALIEEERVIVDETPGTTRDAIDTEITFEGSRVKLVDTAGIRRKPKVTSDLEYYTVKRAFNALKDCDVALVMVDGSVELSRQDKRLINLAERSAGAVIVLLNKMDLVPREQWNEALSYFRHELSYVPYLLLIPVSAKERFGVHDALRIAIDTHLRGSEKFDAEELNEIVMDAVARAPHKRIGKRKVVFSGCRQIGTNPPRIALYTNRPDDITQEYRRYLEKQLRKQIALLGIPLFMVFRRSKRA